MTRYEVIESKAWKRDDGRTASLYGAVPWASSSEEKRWKIVPRGYTIRDNVSGTVGIGRQPWKTRAEAQEWADKANKRVDDLAAARGQATRPAHATKRSPAQIQREINEVLGVRLSASGDDSGHKPINKRKHVRHFSEWKDKTGRTHYAVTYEDRSSHAVTPAEVERYRQREELGRGW